MITAFNKVYPNVKIKYNPLGNNVSTVLSTSIAGGHPPDMADIAQPGYVKQLVQQGHLKPITYAASAIGQNFSAGWRTLGTFNGKLYALVFKASNKSLLWYNVPAFKAAGVQAPKTWAQLITASKTLLASGTPAFSIGGADGWTLTDLFENIYLRTFGPTTYAKLTRAPDQVDRPDGDHRAEGDGPDHRDELEHGRRDERRSPVRLQRLGDERVRLPAEGRDRVRGRLRLGRDPVVDEVEGRLGLSGRAVPDDQAGPRRHRRRDRR